MYVIIVGGGKLGLRVAIDLITDDKDVTLIEKDENRCKFIATQLDTMIICVVALIEKPLKMLK